MKRTIRLIWQLYPTYLLITLIALGAVSWYATHFLSDYFLRRTFSELKTQGRILQVMMARYLDPLDRATIEILCKQIGSSAPTRVTLILPDGEVVGDSEEDPAGMDNHIDRPEVRAALAGGIGRSQRYSKTLDRRMMYVALPILNDNKIQAVLRTSIPLTDIYAELDRIQNNITLGGVLIAFLASLICFYVSRRISQPIEKLRRGAEGFAKGDLSRRLPLPSTRETAGLARAMNDMAARLEQRIETEKNQRNEMEAILSSMTEGVIAIDLEERIVSFNESAARIVKGFTPASKGQDLQAVIRNLGFKRLMERALEDDASISEDIVLHRANRRIVNVHATPMRNSQNARIGTLLVFSDVTQLRHLEKMRKDFVANVSHEIKTPLTAIKGFAETLQSSAMDHPEEAHRFIGIIRKHADRLEAIIEDLLLLSRIEMENEARQIQLQPGNIAKILQSAVQICRTRAEAKNIAIDWTCDQSVTATINAPLLEQALINLIDNAIKYSGEGSQVLVRVRKNGHGLTIDIQDNGIGIARKHLSRLFERFYRVDKARSREQGGTGLGLAIVKHIVHAHGGRIDVESERGRGTTFTIHLPSE